MKKLSYVLLQCVLISAMVFAATTLLTTPAKAATCDCDNIPQFVLDSECAWRYPMCGYPQGYGQILSCHDNVLSIGCYYDEYYGNLCQISGGTCE
jgi:hypothetical protein